MFKDTQEWESLHRKVWARIRREVEEEEGVQTRASLAERYEQYLEWADDGTGRDRTRVFDSGELPPLLTFDEWLER